MTTSSFPPHLKCLAIGGGTGLSTLLKGLKHYVLSDGEQAATRSHILDSLTAVVTVTDDGGSSGRLREEFQILPPGDIRNCLVALSEDEYLLSQLFQYRFPGEGTIRGHSFGNLFLTALTGVTGDFVKAVKLTSEVLAIRGNIVPSTTADVALVAELEDGRIIHGESKITAAGGRVRHIRLEPETCQPLPETLDAIRAADIITLGPGSLFTSIIPNLLVHGVSEAIAQSKALKVYICNIMTQPGETDHFSVSNHIEWLLRYIPAGALDVVLVNNTPVSPDVAAKYREEGAQPIYLRMASELRNGRPGPALLSVAGSETTSTSITVCGKRIPVLASDLLEQSELARHCPTKLAQAVFTVYQQAVSQRRKARTLKVKQA